MEEKQLVPGIRYSVSIKNNENNTYKSVKYVTINSIDGENGCVYDVSETGKELNKLYTGKLEDCFSFVNLMFDVKYNRYDLYHKLQDDCRTLLKSGDPTYRDISKRLGFAMDYIHPLDCTYELEDILRDFHADTKDLDPNDISDEDTLDEVIETYEKLIERQVGVGFGQVMFTDSFKSSVEEGCFTDDDGCGNYLTEDGLEGPSIDFYDLESENWTKYPYVVWYNK